MIAQLPAKRTNPERVTLSLTRSAGDGKYILWLTRQTAHRLTSFAWRTVSLLSDLRERRNGICSKRH
jgi:hypothetical protein